MSHPLVRFILTLGSHYELPANYLGVRTPNNHSKQNVNLQGNDIVSVMFCKSNHMGLRANKD